ncbi:MarR family winged helix-turn-helix transcriptional regulator [Pseudorhodobacter sp. W20_MBD10_FR17]|uniref:MarR family winged helix-turn-helix transcriptional regulator n=1 Tax=Pseudorhodobacter sp. W20_MBD10_FR17 TaxID=3240266 RepID=UPI003F9E523E
MPQSMGMDTSKPNLPQSYQDRVQPHLHAAGLSNAVSDALLVFEAEHFHYMRRIMKGDVPQSLLEELDSGLEATQFHALSAIMRIRSGFGRATPTEPTVGLLAEDLCLDPSRASRIAADLVDRGLIVRAASQSDGRRSILVPTEQAHSLINAFLSAKWTRTLRLFADWPEEDILTFSRLFGRYSEGMREQYPLRHDPSSK